MSVADRPTLSTACSHPDAPCSTRPPTPLQSFHHRPCARQPPHRRLSHPKRAGDRSQSLSPRRTTTRCVTGALTATESFPPDTIATSRMARSTRTVRSVGRHGRHGRGRRGRNRRHGRGRHGRRGQQRPTDPGGDQHGGVTAHRERAGSRPRAGRQAMGAGRAAGRCSTIPPCCPLLGHGRARQSPPAGSDHSAGAGRDRANRPGSSRQPESPGSDQPIGLRAAVRPRTSRPGSTSQPD